MSLAPRAEFGRILRSPALKPRDGSDDAAFWSLNCFVVPRQHRGKGVAHDLLKGALTRAAAGGATAIEAYPVRGDGRIPPDQLYTGRLDWFLRAGFAVIQDRGAKRVVVRRTL